MQRSAAGALLESEELQQQIAGKSGEVVMLRQLNREQKDKIHELQDKISQLEGDLRVAVAKAAIAESPARQLARQTNDMLSQFKSKMRIPPTSSQK